MTSLIPNAVAHFDDNNGAPLAGGQIFFYIPNTSTPKATYQDAAQTILNTNPIILDSRGEAVIWGSGTYRQVVKDSLGNLIWDRITQDPNAGLTGNMTDNQFVAGTDFTPGTTTQLTLTAGPGSLANTWAFFDTLYQDDTQYSISGTTLTFGSPIPIGVQRVTVKIGSTLAIGTPGAGSVTDSSVAANAGIQAAKLSYLLNLPAAVTRTVQDRLTDYVSVKDFGGTWDGSTDVSTVAQAALNSGAKIVDFLNLPGKINTSLTIPAGVEARNLNLIAGTAGMNMVLVNNGCRLSGLITGTGTTNIVERGVYPAVDAVADVEFLPSLTVTNMTFGVHAQFITTDTQANYPRRWRGKIIAKNIVGKVGNSEGYGVLLSPALDCNLQIWGKTVQRHTYYLSAGASWNIADVDIDGNQNVGVQINTYLAQSPSQYNTVRMKARNFSVPAGQAANQVVGCYILGRSHYNSIHIDMDGGGTAEMAVVCEGVSTDITSQPTGNKITGHITGQFIGLDVVRDLGAAQNDYHDMVIDAYATFSVIALRLNGVRSGAGLPFSGPRAYNNRIKALGQNIVGVYDEVTDVSTVVGPIDIRNNGSAARVQIQPGCLRTGFSRRVFFTGNSASVPAGSTGDITVSLNDTVSTTNRNASARVIGASVSMLANSPVVAIFDPAESNVTVRIFNGAASAQTFTVTGVVEGD